MKVKWSSELGDCIQVGDGNLRGKLLYNSKDGIDGSIYEINLKADDDISMTSPFGSQFNHIYYWLSGTGTGKVDGNSVLISSNTVIAARPTCIVNLSATTDARIIAFYTSVDEKTPPKSNFLVRSLTDILGTDRNVNWGRGTSRRFLIKSDGFNLSLHNTLALPNKSSPLTYPKNYEFVYFYEGKVTYTWEEGKQSATYDSSKNKGGASREAMVLMIENDPHVLATDDEEVLAICSFYPPLLGHETHNFSSGASSF